MDHKAIQIIDENNNIVDTFNIYNSAVQNFKNICYYFYHVQQGIWISYQFSYVRQLRSRAADGDIGSIYT